MVRKTALLCVVAMALLVLGIPQLSAETVAVREAITPALNFDVCDWSNYGCSYPGPPGGAPNCINVDCCNMYQNYHLYDLRSTKPWNQLTIVWTPGLSNGCQGTVNVYAVIEADISCANPVPPGTLIYTAATRSRAIPGGWLSNQRTLKRGGTGYTWPADFRAVVVEVTSCYNDMGQAIGKYP